ncbi:DUF1153 domain-containing protein [Roseovarius phycicola]|uniref:DUF1153 domain-containing protein n=1 Tax=Roseovarius phycicola TaxID=3080976 RepID=A0ABZ2HCH3_9RHOB
MYLKKANGPRTVTLPGGDVLTLADLPPENTQRWVISRKLKVVSAVRYGLISQEDAMTRYSLSEEELSEWEHAIRCDNLDSLKATRHNRKNNLR